MTTINAPWTSDLITDHRLDLVKTLIQTNYDKKSATDLVADAEVFMKFISPSEGVKASE